MGVYSVESRKDKDGIVGTKEIDLLYLPLSPPLPPVLIELTTQAGLSYHQYTWKGESPLRQQHDDYLWKHCILTSSKQFEISTLSIYSGSHLQFCNGIVNIRC